MYIQTNDVQAQTDGPVVLSLAPVTLDLKLAIEEPVTTDLIMPTLAFDEKAVVTALPVFEEEAVVTALPVFDEEAVVTTLPVFDSESEELQEVQLTDQSQIVTYAQDLGVIATLYTQVLGRDADADGFTWWAEKEATGDISLGGIAVSMIESDEFLASSSLDFGTQSKGDQIESLYQTILQRDSDQSGKDYWIEQAEQNDMTIQEIAQSFVESEEFAEQSLAPEAWDFLLG